MPEDPSASVFVYRRPEIADDRGKAIQMLCRSDRLVAAVQVVREGGETNLHSHAYLDGFWFVLSGSARFYGLNDEVIAELGPHEGVLIPRGLPYWFENTSDEALELLQVEASSKPAPAIEDFADGRTDFRPRAPGAEDVDAEFLAQAGD